MEALPVKFVADDNSKIWPEIEIGLLGHAPEIAVLDRGMKSGAPSVMILIRNTSAGPVVCQTTAKLLVAAAQTILARYPNLMD
jgi:hypothetical protein